MVVSTSSKITDPGGKRAILHATSFPWYTHKKKIFRPLLHSFPVWVKGLVNTYISGLDNKFNIVARTKFDSVIRFREMEKDLFHHIGPFDKAECVFHRADDTAILDRVCRVFQPDVTSTEVTSVKFQQNHNTMQWSTAVAMQGYAAEVSLTFDS